MEHAFKSFPTGSRICITAGEYIFGSDADGIQMSGPEAAGKSITFVLQSFAGNTDIVLSEDELLIDLDDGTLAFEAGTTSNLVLGIGRSNSAANFPDNTNFLHTLSFVSGDVDFSAVSVDVQESVGNPEYELDGSVAPDSAAIVRGPATILGSISFSEADRTIRYVGSGNRTALAEIPSNGSTNVHFEHTDGLITFPSTLELGGGVIRSSGDGDVLFESPIHLTASDEAVISTSGTGTLTLGSLNTVVAGNVTLLDIASGRLSVQEFSLLQAQAAPSSTIRIENTGFLELGAFEREANADGHSSTLDISNREGASLTLRPVSSTGVYPVDIHNAAQADVVLTGTGRLSGQITNMGLLTVTGSLTISGTVANDDSLAIGNTGHLTVDGSFENMGASTINGGNLVIQLDNAAFENQGSVTALGDGRLRIEGASLIRSTSPLPNLEIAAGVTQLDVTEIDGELAVEPEASVRSINALRILRGMHVRGTFLIEGSLNVTEDLFLTGGQLELGGDLTIDGDLRQSGNSSLILNSNSLNMGGNLVRQGGTFDVGTGALVFSGGRLQTLESGSQIDLHDLHIEEPDTELLLGPTIVDVQGDLTVEAEASLQIGDGLVRMRGDSSNAHVDGLVTTSITGNLGFSGLTGSDQSVTGSGIVQNVLIDLDEETEFVRVEGGELRLSGILTLQRGGLFVSPISRLELTSELTTPAIRRFLGDVNGDGSADGRGIVANTDGSGILASEESGINVFYFGTVTAPADAGAELVTGNVVDIHLEIDSASDSVGVLRLTNDLAFSGDLSIDETSRIDLAGWTMESSGAGTVHRLDGAVLGGILRMSGGGTISGDPTVAHWIDTLSVNSSTTLSVHVSGDIGRIVHEGGVLSLSSNGDYSIGVYEQGPAAPRLRLSSSVRISDRFEAGAGEIDLGPHDLIMVDGAELDGNGSTAWNVSASGSVVFPEGGRLGSPDTVIPRIRFSGADDDTLRLTRNTRIGRSFIHESGVVDLNGHDLDLDARLWTVTTGSYVGDGWLSVSGNLEAELASNLELRKLRVGVSGNVFSVRAPEGQIVEISVADTFKMGGGVLDLGKNDLVLDGPSPAFVYEAGTFQMDVADDPKPDANGEIVFIKTSTIVLEQPLIIPNLRFEETATISNDSSTLTVSGQTTFAQGGLSAPAGGFVLADNARVIRTGTGSPNVDPVLQGLADVYYLTDGRDIGPLESGRELPRSVRHLVVDMGSGPDGEPNTLRLNKIAFVDGVFVFRSGQLEVGDHAPVLNEGAEALFSYGVAPRPQFVGSRSYVTAGPITLSYEGFGTVASNAATFPAAAQIGELRTVLTEQAGGAAPSFTLHAPRSVGRLSISNESSASIFDLADASLTVDSTTVIENGTITGRSSAQLNVGGDFHLHERATVTGPLSVTVNETATIDGSYLSGTLQIYGDLEVRGTLGGESGPLDAEAPGELPDLPNLIFRGGVQTFMLLEGDGNPTTVDRQLNQLVLQQSPLDTGEPAVRLISLGEPVDIGVNKLVLGNGLLRTGSSSIFLPSNGTGFSRPNDQSTSHVAGTVRRQIESGQPNPFTRPFGRVEFPVGTDYPNAFYRLAALAFSEDRPALSTYTVSVSHTDTPAGGLTGFPIPATSGKHIDDTAPFFWVMESSPDIPARQAFNLELLATGFETYSNISNARIIRRMNDSLPSSPWTMHGQHGSYDNALVSAQGRSALFVQSIGAEEPISEDGTIFTVGLEKDQRPFARLQVVNPSNVPGQNEVRVILDDSVIVDVLPMRGASRFVRVDAGTRELIVEDPGSGGVIARASLELLPGQDLIAVADVNAVQTDPIIRVLDSAIATPGEPNVSDVAVATYNGRSDDLNLTFFQGSPTPIPVESLGVGTFSNSYVDVPPQVLEVSVGENGESQTYIISLSGLQGQTGLLVFPASAQPFFVTNHGVRIDSETTVSSEDAAEVPSVFRVHGNYPNPFNPTTTIRFDLPRAADVRIEVYDVLGRQVMATPWEAASPGTARSVQVDGESLASGTYIYRVVARRTSGTEVGSGRMVLVK